MKSIQKTYHLPIVYDQHTESILECEATLDDQGRTTAPMTTVQKIELAGLIVRAVLIFSVIAILIPLALGAFLAACLCYFFIY